MRPNKPTDPYTWLSRAKANLTLAVKGGRLKGVVYEDLCFSAQQAAEKSLKAVCLARGLPIPRTHSLVFLLDQIEASGLTIPEEVREADILTQYAVQTRYPGIAEEVTKDEYRDAVKLASYVVF